MSPRKSSRLKDRFFFAVSKFKSFNGFSDEKISEILRETGQRCGSTYISKLRSPASNKSPSIALNVPLVPRKWSERLLAVRRAAGFAEWPQNVLRHSRVSYRLAQTGNAAQTAREDGHSEAMLHAHYSALVTPEAAERYFSIRPGVENFPSDSTGKT